MSTACCTPKMGQVEPASVFAKLPMPELVRKWKKGVENFDRRLFWLTDEQLDQAFLPDAGVGRWPVRVLLGHVMDADLVAVHRMRRILAEQNPVMAEWDENAFVDSNLYGVGQGATGAGAIGWFVAMIHTLRQGTAQWLAGLSEQQLSRTGMHPSKGQISIRDIATYYTWHLEHHASYLNAKVVRFLCEAPEEPAAGGGCGAGCGCKH